MEVSGDVDCERIAVAGRDSFSEVLRASELSIRDLAR